MKAKGKPSDSMWPVLRRGIERVFPVVLLPGDRHWDGSRLLVEGHRIALLLDPSPRLVRQCRERRYDAVALESERVLLDPAAAIRYSLREIDRCIELREARRESFSSVMESESHFRSL